MLPDVDFMLTAEGFKSYEQSLTAQGIEVRPMSRQTHEDLEKGGSPRVSLSGLLVHARAEYIYEIYQTKKGFRLTVDAYAHTQSSGEALVAAIGRAFPQAERESRRPAVTKRKLDRDRIGNAIGCILILAFLGAICFFLVLGMRSFFKV